ncbi:hypothetical protein Val02_74640 [Virgisporangium aliadipatigenens]|uniref:NfeD-like C-terminal domain-containing protein n=1 Tax=Virgisporangium aliadipatigenens TaxID=741659 RepID=A0A8J4DUY5_9ACTN|nr:hypothetical protein [Virgisporangium aliadipatigenens]GIJ50578.1 hypothetical protein Val02_74640 [Virgisporangium aliadipatigenens]
MDTVTVVLLCCGAVGTLILAVGLFVSDVLPADVDADGVFSVPVIATFVGAFGFAGALGHTLAGRDGPTGIAAAAGAGMAGAVPAAWLAARLTAALMRMPTDATVTASALLGAIGVVVTPIPVGGPGEIRVDVGGQPLKLHARADGALPLGAPVFVVETLSESSVVVVDARLSR